jgi:SWI/SNF-related matrix-associated actin-dependent regulator of chromatin subfamily A member 5
MEPQGAEDTSEKLEEERAAAQEFIDTGQFCADLVTNAYAGTAAEPLSDEELAQKEAYIEQGFPDWSRRDFQQFVKGLEAYGWYVACPESYAC